MKKQLWGFMTILAIFCSCQKNEVTSLSEDVTIHATIEDKDATRTVMDENNNILWSENDQIIAFMKSSYGHKYQVKPSFVGKSYADFTMVSSGNSNDLSAGNELEHNVVYYPYSENIECLKSGANYALEVNLPSEQVYVPDSFANGSMAMVAVSESNNITFKNVLGAIKLQIKGTQTVKSIKVAGKNDEVLSGAAVVTTYTNNLIPAITMTGSDDTSKSVTLNCGGGIMLSESTATDFIIALPPVVFSQGFTVTITDINNETREITTDMTNVVLRSSVLAMPEVLLGEAGNEIETPETHSGDYIDEYGINHGQGVKINGFVWAPVNCGYHEIYYPYGKYYQWGRKYGQSYSGSIIYAGGVPLSVGQSKTNENVFYYGSPKTNYDWLDNQDNTLWNTGTEYSPKKNTGNDPCPFGWRVPTHSELNSLGSVSSLWCEDEHNHVGYRFSDTAADSDETVSIFLPAAGRISSDGYNTLIDKYGEYWSSSTSTYYSYDIIFSEYEKLGQSNYLSSRTFGYSIRCVQE